MDYLKIVLYSYTDPNTRPYLEDYFERECIKTEKLHYKPHEFFTGCLNAVELLRDKINAQLHPEKKRLYELLAYLKAKPDTPLHEIVECKNELQSLSIDNYGIPLNSVHREFNGHIWNNDLEIIEKAIMKVFHRIEAAAAANYEMGKIPRYSILEHEEAIFSTVEYSHMKKRFDSSMYFTISLDGNTVHVYKSELAHLFMQKKIPVTDCNTNQETEIDGIELLEYYAEGYKQGMKFFKDEFAVSKNVLFGEGRAAYIENLREHYLNKQHVRGRKGWTWVKHKHPDTFQFSEIHRYGYFAGILHSADTFMSANGISFSTAEVGTAASKQPDAPTNKTPDAKYFGLAYIFDCHATGQKPVIGSKKILEAIGKTRTDVLAPNTFYKQIAPITNLDLNSEQVLITNFGDEWFSVIEPLLKHPQEVKQYLTNKQLIKGQ
jgi:hypothetical protein